MHGFEVEARSGDTPVDYNSRNQPSGGVAELREAQGGARLLDLVRRETVLPEGWFEESHKALRERLGIPKSCCFKTKGSWPGN
jgi:hypothetical protein